MRFVTVKKWHLQKKYTVILLDPDSSKNITYGEYDDLDVAVECGRREALNIDVNFIQMGCCCICGGNCSGPSYRYMLKDEVWGKLELPTKALAHPWCIHDEILPLVLDDFSAVPASALIHFGYEMRMREEGVGFPKSIVNLRGLWVDIHRLQERLDKMEER